MGIQGLLPFVKGACRPASVDEWRGGVAAVDASCWIYKGAYAAADRLMTQGAASSDCVCVAYVLRLVNMLRANGLHVVLVFDGAPLPAKRGTNDARRAKRETMRKNMNVLLQEGKTREAADVYRAAIEITQEMKGAVLKACRQQPGVDCLVAPFEADAQLAYLQVQQIADVVITEDTDLIPFGCSKVLFKVDFNGRGLLYEKQKLSTVMRCGDMEIQKFQFEKFRRMCILSGCDYLPNLPGIGLARAKKFFGKVSNGDLTSTLPRLPRYLNMQKLVVPTEYIQNFIEADDVFQTQPVFDTQLGRLVPLNDKDGVVHEKYGVVDRSAAVCLQVALGNMTPVKGRRVLDGYDPTGETGKSIWRSSGSLRDSATASRNLSKSQLITCFTREAKSIVSSRSVPASSATEEKSSSSVFVTSRSVPSIRGTSIESDLREFYGTGSSSTGQCKTVSKYFLPSTKSKSKTSRLDELTDSVSRDSTDSCVVTPTRRLEALFDHSTKQSVEQTVSRRVRSVERQSNDTHNAQKKVPLSPIQLKKVSPVKADNDDEVIDLCDSPQKPIGRSKSLLINEIRSNCATIRANRDIKKPGANKTRQVDRKSKLLGPCRVSGLSSKSKVIKKQPTIASYLERFKFHKV